jgi:hypothetical protein
MRGKLEGRGVSAAVVEERERATIFSEEAEGEKDQYRERGKSKKNDEPS